MLSSSSLRSPEHIFPFGFNNQPRGCFASAPNFSQSIVSSPAISDRGLGDIEYVTQTEKRTGRVESNTPSIPSEFPEIGPFAQTSSSARCQISASLSKIDGGYLPGHKLSKESVKRRIKSTLQNLSRSLSIDRSSCTRSDDNEILLENMKEAEPQISGEEAFITSRLLEECSHDTFIIQFIRRFPTQELGIRYEKDEIGLYISRLAKLRHLESIQKYFQVGDRIVSLQGVPAYLLDVSDVPKVIRGSEVITVKIVRPSRR
ncbi:unnamed protein product [Rodentolepis nana]|uniref:PDZ domain-containing protein n=1 Tax=Rodentolepis nana TaxID=102285 RepID=A0A0R3T3R6_RODNA|nr:unnamed protein product [Rodentolepis nana]